MQCHVAAPVAYRTNGCLSQSTLSSSACAVFAQWHAACQAMGGEQRLALQKFKEAPRVTGEWVLDEGSTSPRWRDISEIEQPEDEIRSGFGSGYALFKDMGDL